MEKAICGTPELSAADTAMANAYAGLRAALPRDRQSGLLADQRRWIRARDATCIDNTGRALGGCLLTETEQRRRFLAGEGPNHATDAPRLEPTFFREARKGRYEINVGYPQITAPRSAAENTFNTAAHDLVLGKEMLREIRGSERVSGSPMSSSYDATYDVTYLDRNLVAVVFTISTYGAGPLIRLPGAIVSFLISRADLG